VTTTSGQHSSKDAIHAVILSTTGLCCSGGCDSLALGGGYAAMTCATAVLLLAKLVYCLLLRSTMGQLLLSLQLLSTPKLQSVLCMHTKSRITCIRTCKSGRYFQHFR
jgi:hypothetical protein